MIQGLSIGIVARNEEKNIAAVTESVLHQFNHQFPLEIILLNNNSTDNTVECFKRVMVNYNKVDYTIKNFAENNLGNARATFVNISKHPIVAFIDSDCRAPENWLDFFAHKIGQISDDSIIGIGGGNSPPMSKNSFYSALHVALNSYLGHFKTPHLHFSNEEKKINHLPTCNVFYFKDKLLQIGNFSPLFPKVCEDLELSYRAKSLGFGFLFYPNASVVHEYKVGIIPWAQKMFRYGQGQIFTAEFFPENLLGIKSLPLISVMFLLFSMSLNISILLTLVITYFVILLIFSGVACVRFRRPYLIANVFILLATTHFFYALGELCGLINLIRKKTLKCVM